MDKREQIARMAQTKEDEILLARGYAALESRESPQGTVLALYPV